MSRRPRISVVMAIRNEERYGPEAIKSILDQTYRDFEFIIVDDASTDRTPEILQDFASRDRRIKILTNEENQSAPSSFNRAMAQAVGDYIARMDADDIACPHRFARQAAFLDANADHVLVGGGVEHIDADGRPLRTFDQGANSWEFEWISLFRPPLAHPSAMFRASAPHRDGLFYDPALKTAQDFEYWHRLLRTGKGCELPGVVMKYRIHDRNTSVVYRDRQRAVARRTAIQNLTVRFPDLSPEDWRPAIEYLYATDDAAAPSLMDALGALEALQDSFVSENDFTAKQIQDIRRRTAKLLLKSAINKGRIRDSRNTREMVSFMSRYIREFSGVGIELACRRAGFRKAA